MHKHLGLPEQLRRQRLPLRSMFAYSSRALLNMISSHDIKMQDIIQNYITKNNITPELIEQIWVNARAEGRLFAIDYLNVDARVRCQIRTTRSLSFFEYWVVFSGLFLPTITVSECRNPPKP